MNNFVLQWNLSLLLLSGISVYSICHVSDLVIQYCILGIMEVCTL